MSARTLAQADTFAGLVARCSDLLDQGIRPDVVFNAKSGPCAGMQDAYDMDALVACVEMTLRARAFNRYSMPCDTETGKITYDA